MPLDVAVARWLNMEHTTIARAAYEAYGAWLAWKR
jgi:hypothetical protein